MTAVQAETKRWTIKQPHASVDALKRDTGIREAANLLREGKLVAFPTETVYGLGADARSEEAVKGIFRAKGRPCDNPLIVHIGRREQLNELAATVPDVGRVLIERFWPGPLTLILPHRGTIASSVTAGLDTVGVRMPSHPVALALLREAGVPVAAPSANRSGRPSPTDADHVWEDLAGRIDGLLDGGPTGVGVESTVVDVTSKVPVLLRPGGITLEALQEVVGEVRVDPGLQEDREQPRSPGMKYRHYAPHGEMWLVTGAEADMMHTIQRLADDAAARGRHVGILTTDERLMRYKADWVVSCGRRSDPASVARGLYAALRRFDELGADYILSEAFPEDGIWFTVMNRLRKAAEGRIIHVKAAVQNHGDERQ